MAVAHAPQRRRGVLLLLLVAALVAALPATCAAARSKKSYTAIFSFGDSLSDAGNLIVNGTPKALTTARPPYGMTFFRKPTGRCSNGRLVVDFLGTVPYCSSFFPTPASIFYFASVITFLLTTLLIFVDSGISNSNVCVAKSVDLSVKRDLALTSVVKMKLTCSVFNLPCSILRSPILCF